MLWRWPTPLIRAKLINRYERFIANVELETGERVQAHCVNPGRMEGIVIPGATIWLSQAATERKLKYTWELIELEGMLVGANTGLPNRLVETLLRSGTLEGFRRASTIQREYRVTPEHIVDFRVERGASVHYVEVKNCHLVYPDGVGYFPDSESERATKHVTMLRKHAERGQRSTVLMTIQRADARAVCASEFHDPVFAMAVRKAKRSGVTFRALQLVPSLEGFEFVKELPVLDAGAPLDDIEGWMRSFEATSGWLRKNGAMSGQRFTPHRGR